MIVILFHLSIYNCSIRSIGIAVGLLSACQTGITDFRKAPDEAIGFPAGFLQARVPGVISTLWPVADISTALLLASFYRFHLHDRLDLAKALRKAQARQRDSSADDLNLADQYERRYKMSGKRDLKAYDAMHHYRNNPDAKPFEHPYFWAGFIYSGANEAIPNVN